MAVLTKIRSTCIDALMPFDSSAALFESLGINTHMNYTDLNYGNLPLVIEQLRALGIKHLRDGVHGWPNLDAFSYYNDIYSKVAIELGCKWNCVIDPVEKFGELTPNVLYGFYAGYAGQIESLEGINEPDVGSPVGWPDRAKEWQQKLYADANQLPQVPASLPVWGFSLAYATQNAAAVGDISSMCEAANLHPYPAGQAPEPVLQDQLQYGKIMAGSKPIMVTETGYFTGTPNNPNANGQPSISEEAAGKYTLRLYLDNFMNEVPRTWLYELQDEGTDANWGLVRWDGTTKPAFRAVSNLVTLLNRTHAYPLRLGVQMSGAEAVTTLLLQNTPSEWLLFLWQPVSVYDVAKHGREGRKQSGGDIQNGNAEVILSFSSSHSTVEVYEPFVQRAPLRMYSEVTNMAVDVPDHPVVLKISS